MSKAKKIAKLLLWATLIWAGVYIVRSIIAGLACFTSFPWWNAFAFAGIYFGPALLLEGTLWGILVFIDKRI
ncbi:MAG: hypothetical protein J6C98_08880 [Oscillospiraceae bacterium]|nr:hypothetical protein [Oscillospiraceae bacterium]